ncbi:MAG: hypothetical protein S4CHLAM81_01710 [Chlamydiales bacterium]|nr:hypothetical protein [Chlamydiales bacterium]MCH9634967.1 hypothetical protein [Chlamydiales bacterium]MCH9704426.1 class I SAM-dependent methyltransferase [Chlamydiota bacterium]
MNQKIRLNSVSAKAHLRWKQLILPGDLIVDATCGNGHDSLFILEQLNHTGFLVAYDIQQAALESTQMRIGHFSNYKLKLQSHEFIEEEGVRLICYNLGYLPGSDKSVTTMTKVTLNSLESAKKALLPGGLLSITCYPGHEEGSIESEAVRSWAKSQKCQLEIIETRSPFLLLLQF